MTSLRIHTLGPLTVELNGRPVETSRHKALALLVYLVVTQDRHRRDALSALLWPDYEQPKAYAYLRRTVWEINEMLGEGWLDADRESVGLATSADLWLDLAELRGILAACRSHGHPPTATCNTCVDALQRTMELARGDFLAGFSLRESSGFDDWQRFISEEVRREVADALKRLSIALAQRREVEAALQAARRWLALDPLDEEAHRQIMLIYALAGQRNAALRQYHECIRLLQTEMGVPPERKTAELAERIQRDQLPRFSPDSPLPTLHPPLSTLHIPQPTTPFVGRDSELVELDHLLGDPAVRLVTILAVGGMGKTRLAIEIAARQAPNFAHGVCFVELAPLQFGTAILPTLADALGLTFREDLSQTQQVLDFLREKMLLLVFDNFEHLVESAALVSDLLQAAPQIKVLTTSRAPLGLQGEVRFHLGGLDVPGADTTEDAFNTAAVRLFAQGARRAQPSFKLEGGDLQDVVRIVRLVQGMPLGILLAAGWVEMMSPQEIAGEIARSLDFLATELQDIPQRQRSMRAVFAQTWAMLSEREQQAFACLSTFRGGFSRLAAQEIGAASLRELIALVSRSLLQRIGEGRFLLHELLRQYGAEKLAEESDAFVDAHDRHSAYFCAKLVRWGEDLKGPKQRDAVVEMEADVENMRVAWSWAAIDGQIDRLARALEPMCRFFFRQRRLDEGEAACRSAVDALGDPAGRAERALLAHLLAWQCAFANNLGRTQEAAELLRASHVLLENVSTKLPQARTLRAFVFFCLGSMELQEGNVEEAERWLEQSLALYREADDPWWIAETLGELSQVTWTQNDLLRTQAYLEECLRYRRALGDNDGLADSLFSLGALTVFDLGQVGEGAPLLQESAELLEKSSDRVSAYRAGAARGSLLRATGRFAEELPVRQGQLAVVQDLGDLFGIADAHRIVGEVLQHLGRYTEADGEGRRSLDMIGNHPPRYLLYAFRLAWAATLLALGKNGETQQLLEDSLPTLRAMVARGTLGRTLVVLSRAKLTLGDTDAAWQHALEALDLLNGRHYYWLLEPIAAVALLFAQRGEVMRGVELYALAETNPLMAQSRWFIDLFKQPIEAAAAGLPEKEVAAARKRGQGLDLWKVAQELLAELNGQIVRTSVRSR